MTASRIPQTALYQEVAERLRQRIYSHDLEPGAWIDEQALAEGYGISRTPLREALKVLASEGLVNLIPRRGCYVTEISEQDLDEIFPLLAMLEGRCAAEATRRADKTALKKLRTLHDALEKHGAEGRIDAFFEANQAFHAAVQTLAHNRWLMHVIADLRKVLKLTRLHSLSREGRVEQSIGEHRDILAAIESGHPDAADQAMQRHLLNGRAAVGRTGTPGKTLKTA